MRLPLLCLLAVLLVPLRAAEPAQPQGERRKAKGEGAPAGEKPLSPFAQLAQDPAAASPGHRRLGPSPFFQPGDVIALVGGEDMVVASEYGYLELLLTRALPDYHLRFRNLAWEGDTVFEQRRDLNFPTWEEQLDKIGATVVIAQFGQMESLMGAGAPGFPGSAGAPPGTPPSAGGAPSAAGGAPALPEFIAAYEKLIERFSGGGKRRVAIVEPTPIERGPAIYRSRAHWLPVQPRPDIRQVSVHSSELLIPWTFRDTVHLDEGGQRLMGEALAHILTGHRDSDWARTDQPLLPLIVAKNRLWFDYWRPQNWAFLAGDRTAQPSSRDHLDPSKRWFPPEREAFLPLIEAKEKEIDALAAQLAQPAK